MNFKTIKVSEATTLQLNYLVAKCEGLHLYKDAMLKGVVMEGWHASGYYMDPNLWARLNQLNFSTNWAQSGPIIEREDIEICLAKEAGHHETEKWMGVKNNSWFGFAPTPLIAAMRCYVASKLGDEVEVPEELQ